MPLVLVEIPPELTTTREATVLVQACSIGLQGDCVLPPDRGDRAVDAVAIVHWADPSQFHARVEVGAKRGEGMVWQARELAFREQDAGLERWRSLGFVIATMARAVMPSSTGHRMESGATVANPPAAVAPAPRRNSVAVGGALGWAADPSGTRWGAWVAGGRQVHDWVRVALRIEHLRLRSRPDLELSWTAFAAGVGPQLELGAAGVVRAEVLLLGQLIQATAEESSTGETASDSRLLPGLAFGIAWAWPRRGPWAALIGAETGHLSGATGIRSRGSDVERSAASYAAVRAGIEARF